MLFAGINRIDTAFFDRLKIGKTYFGIYKMWI